MSNNHQNIEIIFCDNHLLAVNKPAGIVTQAPELGNQSLEAMAKEWLKSEFNKPGKVFLEAVHRLDRPVSGVVLFARTSKALTRLMQNIREKQWEKTYQALVQNKMPNNNGILVNFIIHAERCALISTKNNPEAKKATLSYKVIKDLPNAQLLEINLQTGRYHQIRCQLAHLRCPILGDRKYGSKLSLGNSPAIALHHVRLKIKHPVTHEEMTFESPTSFSIFLNALRKKT